MTLDLEGEDQERHILKVEGICLYSYCRIRKVQEYLILLFIWIECNVLLIF